MTDQGQLPIHTSSLGAPEVSAEEVDRLCDWLRGRGWMKAAEISQALSIDDRRIRAIAQHSDGRILSGPGCPGYMLFTGRTEIEEADRCACRIESQAKQMFARAVSIRRRFHRYAKP